MSGPRRRPRAPAGASWTLATPLLAAALLAACQTGPGIGPVTTELPADGAVLPTFVVRGLWLAAVELPGVPGRHLTLLDTGTDRTLLDLPLALKIGLRSAADETVTTATGGTMPSVRMERLPWLGCGEATFRGVEVAALDLRPLREQGGLPIVGILGCDLFRQCLLELDFGRRRARALPRHGAPRDGGHAFAERLPWVDIDAAGRPLRVLVDTGFQDLLAVPPELPMPWRTIPRRDGELATLDGVHSKSTGRLDGDLVLGALRWPDPRVVLAPGQPKVGTALLRRSRVLLDAAGGRIWIERSAHGRRRGRAPR